jgi:3-hydroxyacyl-CoA dehydrogenase
MSEGFRKHFMSTHFYNPPGKMIACEIASTDDTDPAVYEFVKGFLRDVLGREIIAVNNIPGFAGNRIAFVLFNYITCLAQEHGVEMMDYLIGPYTGRLMPPLATIDLVGLDIHKAIIRSLQDNTNDYMHDSLKLPDYIDTMLNGGLLGRKSGSGFYKRLESGKRMFYDPTSNEYVPGISPHVLFVEKARGLIHLGMYKQAFEVIKSAKGPEADIVKDILCMYVSYSYSLIGEVTKAEDGIMGIDDVMSYGFNWAPPSVIVKVLGGKGVVCQMLSERGFLVPQSLSDEVETDNEIVGSGKYFVS